MVADGGETDSHLFTVITADNGQSHLQFTGDGDEAGFGERKGLGELYRVRVEVSDGEFTFTRIVEIAEGSLFIEGATAADNQRIPVFVDTAGDGLLDENDDGSTTDVEIGTLGGGQGSGTKTTHALAVESDVAGEDTGLYDNALFDITSGTLSFTGGDSGDFEAGDSWTIRVKVTDSVIGVTFETYTIRLADVNDTPAFVYELDDVDTAADVAAEDIPQEGQVSGQAEMTIGAAEAASVTIHGVTFTNADDNPVTIKFTQGGLRTVITANRTITFNFSTGATNVTPQLIFNMWDGFSGTLKTAVTAVLEAADPALRMRIDRLEGGYDLTPMDADYTVTEDSDSTAMGSFDLTAYTATGTLEYGAAGDTGATVTGTGDARVVTYTGTYGTLTLNSDGSWLYMLDNDAAAVQALAAGQTHYDTFTVTITDVMADPNNNVAGEYRLVIEVNGAGDAPVQGFAGDPIPVTEGADVILTEAMLPVSDQDAGDNLNGAPLGSFTYTVSNLVNGAVQLRDDAGNWGDTTSFTLQDLRDGKVRFLHDGGEQFMTDADGYATETPTPAGFEITIADDDSATSAAIRIDLAVTEVNDAPVLGTARAHASVLIHGVQFTINAAGAAGNNYI